MASYPAIASTCEAIVRLLRATRDPAAFGGAHLDFEVYVAEDFRNPMDTGVSLFLYRIYQSGTNRTPAGRALAGRRQQRRQLPLELHFMLTAWAKKASLQHEIAGWMMRVMEDVPTIPAALLNAYSPEVFEEDEAVEATLTTLSVDDMFHIWDVMINHVYQLSIPYVVRPVAIDSTLSVDLPGLVQERVDDFRQLEVVSAPFATGAP